MNQTKSISLPMKLFATFGLISFLFSSFVVGQVSTVSAQDPNPPTPSEGIQLLAANGSSLYYYVDGQRLNLTPSLDWVSVKFVSSDAGEQQAVTGKFSSTVTSLDGARQVPHLGLTLLPLQDGLGTKTLVQGVNSMRASSSSFSQVNPVYSYAGVDMVVSDEFIATFPPEMGIPEIEAINTARGVEVVSSVLEQENTFVLRVTAASSLDALAMANHYQESGLALSAAPNFVRLTSPTFESSSQKPTPVGPMFVPDDSYYLSDQWYLNNTKQYGAWMAADADIDAPEAWDITQGSSSIIIAIIDEGVDLTHQDLLTNLVAGYDATGLGSAGGQAPLSDDAHGTAVAGIAAAVSNNTQGVSGVCQLCKIMPVRIAYGDGGNGWIYTDAWAANGITWAYTHGASVLNNSWGGGLPVTVVNTAITNATINGRSGKGAVVVASAGNDNNATVSWPASQSDVISVGALNMCDQRKNTLDGQCGGGEGWGSNFGSALDVMAAGVWLTTTDIMGNYGASDINTPTYGADYDGYMNGTSGAAPIVSGVVGLMLSINPYMTSSDVQEILQKTADDLGIVGWDDDTGYGRVNALAAVTVAQKPNLVITGYQFTLDEAGTNLLPGSVPANTTFYIKTFVKNQGGTNATAFYRSAYFENRFLPLQVSPSGHEEDYEEGCLYSSTPTSPDRGDFYATNFITGIPAGNSDNGLVKIPVTGGLSAGSYKLWLYADPTCTVAESREEKNNNAYGPINITIGTAVDVNIAGTPSGSYVIPVGGREALVYDGTNNGPVQVVSTNGGEIITSERAYRGAGYTDWNEMMGFPANQLATEYWFPWYATTGIAQTYLVIGNTSPTQSANVSVYIAGQFMKSYVIPVNGREIAFYEGVNDGPVHVVSTNGVKVVTSERAFRGAGYTDWNEMMGFPANQLTTEYWFPWYATFPNSSITTFLAIGNASLTESANVSVYIAGELMDSYVIPVGGRETPVYDVNNGPVQVISTNGVNIITSERAYRGTGYTDWNEMMGFPANQLATEYWFPWYATFPGSSITTFLAIGNASLTESANVSVYIAGVLMDSYVIPVGGKETPVYDVNSGPVQVISTNGVDIITSERAYRGTGYTDWNEMVGFPANQLTTEYWFPAYDTTGTAITFLAIGNAQP